MHCEGFRLGERRLCIDSTPRKVEERAKLDESDGDCRIEHGPDDFFQGRKRGLQRLLGVVRLNEEHRPEGVHEEEEVWVVEVQELEGFEGVAHEAEALVVAAAGRVNAQFWVAPSDRESRKCSGICSGPYN